MVWTYFVLGMIDMVLNVYFVIYGDSKYDYMDIYGFYMLYICLFINHVFDLMFVFIVYKLTLISLFVREVKCSCFVGIFKSDF